MDEFIRAMLEGKRQESQSSIDYLPPSERDIDPYAHTQSALSQAQAEDNQPLREPLDTEGLRNLLAMFASASSRTSQIRVQDATRWSGQTFRLPTGQNNCISIAGRDHLRKSLIIKNIGTQDVYVSPNEGVTTSGTSFILQPNESVTLNNTSEVFIGTDSTWVEGSVTILQERYE